MGAENPPGMLGLGIGGTAEKAMAKEALMEPIDIQELIQAGPNNHWTNAVGNL